MSDEMISIEDTYKEMGFSKKSNGSLEEDDTAVQSNKINRN